MRKRLICFFILIGLTLCFFVSCNSEEYEVLGKTYVYEKEGFGGNFTIRFTESGRVDYYEGMLSSHLGIASWSREGNTITISENVQGHYKEYRFKVKKDRIEYVKDGSDNFLYMKLDDGARFFESAYKGGHFYVTTSK